MILQPNRHGGVQVVGGFIQKQKVRRLHQHGRKSRTAALPAGQRAHFSAEIHDSQPGKSSFRLIFQGIVPLQIGQNLL